MYRLPSIITIAVLLLSLVLSICHGQRLQAFIGGDTEDPQEFQHWPALFGYPPQNTMLTGTLVYGSGDGTNTDGCAPFNQTTWSSIVSNHGVVVVLVDRTPEICDFVPKVLHAQQVGAAAVIVADNLNEARPPYMKDDGTGSSVRIPSVIIRTGDGELLKSAIRDLQESVIVRIFWEKPAPNKVVTVDFWTSSNDAGSAAFKNVFQTAVNALGDKIQFVPHYFIQPGKNHAGTSSPLRGAMCANNNTYCVTDPLLTPVTDGFTVLFENLRQICLWNYTKSIGRQDLWWKYVFYFNTKCVPSDFSDACGSRGMSTLGAQVRDGVVACMTASGGVSKDVSTPNTQFEKSITDAITFGVQFVPVVIANGGNYRESLNCPAPVQLSNCPILQFVCEGYSQDALPEACQPSDCPLLQKKDDCGQCGGNNACKQSNGISVGLLVALLIGLAIVLLLFGVWWQRRQRRRMKLELDNILASYMPMTEDGGQRAREQKKAPLSTRIDEGELDTERLI